MKKSTFKKKKLDALMCGGDGSLFIKLQKQLFFIKVIVCYTIDLLSTISVLVHLLKCIVSFTALVLHTQIL